MKKITPLKRMIPFIALLIISIQGNTQNNPVGCNGQYYVSYGPVNASGSGNTFVDKLSFSGSTISRNTFTLSPASIKFNAMGLNPIDGYIYAIQYPASNAKAHLLKIGVGGTNVTDLGAIAALDNEEIAYSATFDATGTFYFTTDGGRFLKITNANLVSRTASVISATGFQTFADIAVNPVGGIMYGTTNSNSSWLKTINSTTGAVTNISASNLPNSTFFASLFFDEIGNLYGYRSDNPFYLINKTTGALTTAGSGVAYSGADGCSCSFGRVFHDLASQKGICPTLQNPNPTFNDTVFVTNQTSSQKTGLTFTLQIPGKRFSFNENTSTIASRLFAKGVLPSANAAFITISSVAPGTNNKIVVTSFQTGATNTTDTFTLQLKLVTLGGGLYSPVAMQSVISGLPAAIGSTDLSNDPRTAAPDDSTVVNFCPNITLPVRLLSFSGSYKNNLTLLNWEADNQVNFSYYDLERSSDGFTYSSIAIKSAQGSDGGKLEYEYTDDLSSVSSNVLYYRLKMVDIDGRFSYSKVVLIRRDEDKSGSLSIHPNPVVSTNSANIRINASKSGKVELKVIDMSGVVVLSQQNNISQGSNSISLINLDRLQPGVYVLKMNNGDQAAVTTKFSVIR